MLILNLFFPFYLKNKNMRIFIISTYLFTLNYYLIIKYFLIQFSFFLKFNQKYFNHWLMTSFVLIIFSFNNNYEKK
jgi:hypothetical protein